MTKTSRFLLVGALAGGLFGCAKDSGPSDCQLGDVVGACCTPLNGGGQAMTDGAGKPLQGACNASNLCQYGLGLTQNAPAQDGVCGAATVGPQQDQGISIIPPGDDAGPSGHDVGTGGVTADAAATGGSTGGAAGGDPGTGGATGGSGGAAGGAIPADPCDGVRCPAGAECDPNSGRCVPLGGGGAHAGPCATPDECPPGDECVAETDANRVPGGFCSYNCQSDLDCGNGLRCLPVGQGNLCFASCAGQGDCRDGWTCIQLNDGSGGICQPDCRTTGCGAGEVCNNQTGTCEAGCPYACANGEECTQGHCVRLNHTCTTDYHCQVDTEFCHDGTCVPVQGTDCTNDPAACAASEQCFNNGANGSLCLFGCAADEDCPTNELCYGQAAVCWYQFCGDPNDPNGQNGTVLGTCAVGQQQQWEGTCFPLPVGDPANPGAPGICFEAGRVPEGGACNAQADGRDAAARAQQCVGGTLCFNDPDDPLDPSRNFDATGECAGLCNPGTPRCSAGRTCLDFSTADDATTPNYDETRTLGLCVESDCNVATGAGPCGAGRQCRPYTLTARQGQCGAAGNSAIGESCHTAADCGDEAFCGDPGGGSVCLQICDDRAANPACPGGQQCVNNGWAYGICLPM